MDIYTVITLTTTMNIYTLITLKNHVIYEMIQFKVKMYTKNLDKAVLQRTNFEPSVLKLSRQLGRTLSDSAAKDGGKRQKINK